MALSQLTAFEVDRSDITRSRVIRQPLTPLADGDVLLAVDRFALTANNITYATLGESFGYWRFFPTSERWGRIPVWGHAAVSESANDQLATGTRVYGFLPMASHLVVRPERVRGGWFVDGMARRAALPAPYNAYQVTSASPGESVESADREDRRALLSPLFVLSFLVDDYLAEQRLWGADQVVMSSASSKSAIGAAYLLHCRGVPVTGLTSARSSAFVEKLGIFDEVVEYSRLRDLDRSPAAFVDVSGDAELRSAVETILNGRLVRTLSVGLTHWDRSPWHQDPKGHSPSAIFSAPERIVARTRDWGRAGFQSRFASALEGFTAWSTGWLELVRTAGDVAVEDAYRRTLSGLMNPAQGIILSMSEAPS
jgi:hypothetical protein